MLTSALALALEAITVGELLVIAGDSIRVMDMDGDGVAIILLITHLIIRLIIHLIMVTIPMASVLPETPDV